MFGIVSNGPGKMASMLGDGTGPGGSGPSRCLLLLQRSLAIQLTRGPPPQVLNASQRESPKEHPADEMWMYDKGYNLFQVSRRTRRVIRNYPYTYFPSIARGAHSSVRASRPASTFFHVTIRYNRTAATDCPSIIPTTSFFIRRQTRLVTRFMPCSEG